MRDDISFSNKMLTTEEFSKKYWLNGKAVYQYHTATIEDGRDEREQFLFNNCRALKEIITSQKRFLLNEIDSINKRNQLKLKKLTAFVVTSAVINLILTISAILLLWFK